MFHLRRWTRSLVDHVDALIVQVENHEGQVATAIEQLGRLVRKANGELDRLQRDGAALRDRRAQESHDRDLWRERASREPDDRRALECLRRGRQACAQLRHMDLRIAEHHRHEQALVRHVAGLEQRLADLVEQRDRMATRQTRAEALATVRGPGGSNLGDLEAVLERWDARVTTAECEQGCAPDSFDVLDQDFEDQETERALRVELAELRRQT